MRLSTNEVGLANDRGVLTIRRMSGQFSTGRLSITWEPADGHSRTGTEEISTLKDPDVAFEVAMEWVEDVLGSGLRDTVTGEPTEEACDTVSLVADLLNKFAG